MSTSEAGLSRPVTDRAGVLRDQVPALETELDELRSEAWISLFVAYVDTFDGLSGERRRVRRFSASRAPGRRA